MIDNNKNVFHRHEIESVERARNKEKEREKWKSRQALTI